MNNTSTTLPGGFLTPTPKEQEFGMRVTKVEGGYLINKFGTGKMEVCVTLEEARTIVSNFFDEMLNPVTPGVSEIKVEDLPENQTILPS